jgi:hypothetical protein
MTKRNTPERIINHLEGAGYREVENIIPDGFKLPKGKEVRSFRSVGNIDKVCVVILSKTCAISFGFKKGEGSTYIHNGKDEHSLGQ